MIGVRLEGRLGNQLFQYAFVHAMAAKLGTNFYIDPSVEPSLVDRYFEVPVDRFYFLRNRVFSIKGYKNIFTFYLKRAFYRSWRWLNNLQPVILSNSHTPVSQLAKCADRKFFIGYMQSQTYFEHHQQKVRELFRVKPEYQQQYQEVARDIPADKKIVVVHVRRGDYLELFLNLAANFYHKAVENVNADDVFFVFISDEPDFIAKEFAYLKNKSISYHSEIIDLQWLINGDILIISNSSYGWWGAWLNNKPGKIVYAPQNWITFGEPTEYPLGISEGLDYHWIK